MLGLVVPLVCLPVLALALLQRRQLIRSTKWTVILGVAYLWTTAPMITAPAKGSLLHYGPGRSAAWLVFPIMLVFGLTAGWGLWKLMEASRPPAARY